LSRFLFENQSEIVTAHEVAGDSTTDLAVVRVDADTSGYPTIPVAIRSVKPGDRVLALGHPQENVWSFTQGVVGSIQQGAIQHDAAISHGSSGGPLLDVRGDVVGINIAMVLNESKGLAFARPISLAARYLGDRSGTAFQLDLSTPESSAVSCWRAQEIARVEVGECFDWESEWKVFNEVAHEAQRIAPSPARETLRTELAQPDLKERWLESAKHHVSSYFIEGPEDGAESRPEPTPMPAEVVEARAQADREQEGALRSHPELRGILTAQNDAPKWWRERLRMGIRVERSVRVDERRTWIELGGKNPDGSIYHFSELYVKIGDRWLQRSPPSNPDLEALPNSFAPPLCTIASYRARKLEKLLRNPGSLRALRVSAAPLFAPAHPAPAAVCTTASC
ncbi:MAG TPA: S1C family serine protease, partial [Polyangiaceae bacterium]